MVGQGRNRESKTTSTGGDRPRPVEHDHAPSLLRLPGRAQDCNEKKKKGVFASSGGSVMPGTQWSTTMGKPRGKSTRRQKSDSSLSAPMEQFQRLN